MGTNIYADVFNRAQNSFVRDWTEVNEAFNEIAANFQDAEVKAFRETVEGPIKATYLYFDNEDRSKRYLAFIYCFGNNPVGVLVPHTDDPITYKVSGNVKAQTEAAIEKYLDKQRSATPTKETSNVQENTKI